MPPVAAIATAAAPVLGAISTIGNIIAPSQQATAQRDVAARQEASQKYGVDVGAKTAAADLAERTRQADLEEAFRRAQLGTQSEQFGKSLAEQSRQFGVTSTEAQRQADLRAAIEREQLGEQSRQFGVTSGLQAETQAARQKAYKEALERGESQMSAAEKGFAAESGQRPEELEQLRKDILSGKSEAMQRAGEQMQSNIEQAGVRGGQAATQLRHGLGEMGISAQRDINKLISDEALQRAAERRAYLAAKGARGQAGAIGGINF